MALSPNAGVRLKPPHRYTGAAFAQYVAFDPPLGQGEQATVGIEGSIARYKHRYVEDLVAATMQSASGPRTHDFNSRRVTLPTRELLMTVFLPEESGARPIGPQVGRSLYQMDFKEASRLTADGSFRVEEMEIGGHRGTKMTLHVKEPQMRRHYRLAWELGQRPVSSLE